MGRQHLEYIKVTRSSRNDRVYLQDLKSLIGCIGKKCCPFPALKMSLFPRFLIKSLLLAGTP